MEFTEVLKGRRSVRKYTDQEILDETLKEIVEAARYAPSWKNSQVVSYIIIKDEALKQKFAETCVCSHPFNQKTVSRCKALAVQVYEHGISGYEKDQSASTSKGSHWESFDAGIAAEAFCLAAYDKGVGTVILGIIDEDKTKEVLQLAENQRIGSFIAMGYPEKIGEAPARKETEELLTIL